MTIFGHFAKAIAGQNGQNRPVLVVNFNCVKSKGLLDLFHVKKQLVQGSNTKVNARLRKIAEMTIFGHYINAVVRLMVKIA